eukprot:378923_1
MAHVPPSNNNNNNNNEVVVAPSNIPPPPPQPQPQPLPPQQPQTQPTQPNGTSVRGEFAPTHFIPQPSYYNPPAPGQDVDRRQLKRNNNNNNSLQPRRRAVRRRKPGQQSMNNATNNNKIGDTKPTSTVTVAASLDKPNNNVSISKPRPSAPKRRGFFNRKKKASSP